MRAPARARLRALRAGFARARGFARLRTARAASRAFARFARAGRVPRADHSGLAPTTYAERSGALADHSLLKC